MSGRIVAFMFIALLTFSALFFLIKDKRDVRISFYERYNDIKRTHAQDKGWIPEIIDQYTYNITEQHNIDTGFQLIEFNFRKEYNPSAHKNLHRIDEEKVKIPLWLDINNNDASFYFFTHEEGTGYMVLDLEKSKGLYWSE